MASAPTIFTVFAFHAGKIAAKAPVKSDRRTCNMMVVFEISNTGNNVPVTFETFPAGNVNAIQPFLQTMLINKTQM